MAKISIKRGKIQAPDSPVLHGSLVFQWELHGTASKKERI